MSLFGSWLGMTDEQAMWRVQMHDDAEAFTTLLYRWEQPIYRLCFRMLGDEHRAKDMTQEAFTKIYTRRKEYQHGAKFSTFLWRVATNTCLDELRRLKRRGECSISSAEDHGENEVWEELESASASPEQRVCESEEAAMIRQALERLPEHYRAVVILRHFEDLKFREIAQVLEIPEGTVKSRMSEALELLAQQLKRAAAPFPKPKANQSVEINRV